ncbi:MAG: inorganic diphosphatase [Rickettsiales bacterium]
MNLSALTPGKTPDEINVVVEVPMGVSPVKYEMDKESGALFVDRIIHTAMYYPCNYGFIPGTLGKDGDPLDALVASTVPFVPGSVVKARPVGVLLMEDESGCDEKIVAVPVSKTFPYFDAVKTVDELPAVLCDQIRHFFEHYKDLEKGKWVKVTGWGDLSTAKAIIADSVK